MARPEMLVPGNCYFRVGFYDRDMRYPMIRTLTYVGQDEFPDLGRVWLFSEPDDPSERTAYPDDQLHSVLDFEGLMCRLRVMAADHPLHPLPELAIEPAGDAEFAPLPAVVEQFLAAGECLSVTMTIRFTDDALAVGRREGGFEMIFYTHPWLASEDARLFELFGGLGQAPVVNRLVERGRTRILHFACPTDAQAIVDLCRRVLLEVYAMRRGDVLDISPITTADVERMRAESAAGDPEGPGEHGDGDGHP